MSTTVPLHWITNSNPASYLKPRDFGRMMMAAIIVHVLVLAAIMLWPRPEVVEIPVRTLNITLGSADMSAAFEAPEPSLPPLEKVAVSEEPVAEKAAPSSEPEKVISFTPEAKPEPKPREKQHPEPVPAATPKAVPTPAPKPKAKAPSNRPSKPVKVSNGQTPKRVKIEPRRTSTKQTIPANVPNKVKLPSVYPPIDRMQLPQGTSPSSLASNPYQYVRRVRPEGGQVQVGEASGTQTTEQIRARYEQKISAWLQQHRVFPSMARQLGQHGTPVLRVRIDRRGAVKYFAIERATGHQLIDEAALDMVRRADPFPAPPANYPGGGLLEFLIPVKFALK